MDKSLDEGGQSVAARTDRIVSAIRQEEARVRAKYAVLKHQDAIAVCVLLFSVGGIVTSGYLYFLGSIPAAVCIVATAFLASLSQELEHDLIHKMYFRKNPIIQNLMMFIVWMVRPVSVSPWYRRDIHLLHHRTSGTAEDLEERLIGNGIKNHLIRFIVMVDGFAGLALRSRVLMKDNKRFSLAEVLKASFPFTYIHYTLWHTFLVYHLAMFAIEAMGVAMPPPAWMKSAMGVVDFWVVVLIAPNVLRQFCLNFTSSYMHYFGDGISNLFEETQIVRQWYMRPVQLFCFNFGITHTIHHFYPSQPFFVRSLVADHAEKVMIENGVKCNDRSGDLYFARASA
jgi:fatty acid desaturase